MALPSDNDMREAVAKADSDLQYVLEEAGASLATMYRVTAVHRTRRRFQAIADTRAEARKAAKDDFGVDNATPEGRAQTASVVAAWELAKEYSAKETELKAESKILGQKRILQTQERQAMLKAVTDVYGKLNEGETPSADYLASKAEECEINEPTASSLDRISSKRDQQVEALQTSIDATGHVRVTKTLQKLELPHNSESYRRLMRIEAYTWLAMSARFKAKTWLQGLKLEHFTKFVDFILGDKVAGLRLPSTARSDMPHARPPWQVVLREWKLRYEAFKLVVDDGETLADALSSVMKDPSLKESYFTTPLALQGHGEVQRCGVARHLPAASTHTWKGQGQGKGKAERTCSRGHDAGQETDLLCLQCARLHGGKLPQGPLLPSTVLLWRSPGFPAPPPCQQEYQCNSAACHAQVTGKGPAGDGTASHVGVRVCGALKTLRHWGLPSKVNAQN